MGDVEGLVVAVVVVNAGDGDSLWGVPVAVGEGQCATDGRRIAIAAGGGDGDIGAWGGVEPHGVGLAADLSHGERVGREAQAGDVVVGGGKGVVADRDAAVAAGGMADGRRAVAGIDVVVIDAGDGDGLFRVPVGRGEGQCVTDGGRREGAAGGRDGDVAAGFGVEDDGVACGAAVFSGIAAGSRQGDGGGVVVGGGEGVGLDSDAAVVAVAAGGGMANGRGAVEDVLDGVVNAGDGDGLCRVPVAGGEGQYATDGRCRAVVAGGRDGDVAAGFGVEDDGVGRRTAVFTGIAAGSRQGDGGGVVVGGGEHVGLDSDAAVVAVAAGGGMANGRRAVAGIVDVIVNAGDGDGLCGVPVRHGERQCATDGGRREGAAGGGHSHAGGRFAAEDDVVDRRIAVFSGTAAGGRQGDVGGVVVGGGEGVGVHSDALVVAVAGAGGGMADAGCAVGVVVDVVIDAGDGDGLCGVPVGCGEGQCATDGGRRAGVAGGRDGDVAAGFGVEDDGVLGCTTVFSGIAAGGRQGDVGGVVVGGGHAHDAGDAAVAAAAGGMGDVEGLVCTIVIVNAGDGDGLCRAKVAVGEGQCATDGRRTGVDAGGDDGDVVGWGGVEHHGVGGGVAFVNREGGAGEGDARRSVDGDAEGVGHRSAVAVIGNHADVGTADGLAGNGNYLVSHADCRHSGVVGHHAVGECVVVAVREGGTNVDRAGATHAERLVGNFSVHSRCVVGGGGSRGHLHAADQIVVVVVVGGCGVGDVGATSSNAADGHGLCQLPVAGGKRQRGRADGGGSGVAAFECHRYISARLGIKLHGIFGSAILSHAKHGAGKVQARLRPQHLRYSSYHRG